MSQARPTPYLIRIIRCLRLSLIMAWIALGTAMLYPVVSDQRRLTLRQRWSRQILKSLSIVLEASPTDAPAGSLIVANHISWLDIFVINSLRPSAFVAKTEIRQWPFIGWLAARHDTVFLRRGSRGHARMVNTEINALLNDRRDAVIFPEGTTTNGTSLLGFHAALLQPAIETGHPVLPLALSYHDADGRISLAPSYAGDTTMRQCITAILACRRLTVRLVACPSIDTTGINRREVSQTAHAAIAAVLATRNGFQPSSSPPGKVPDPQAG
jgi:1-acyl-sn-glycerol-3-phosphate acyltransferase